MAKKYENMGDSFSHEEETPKKRESLLSKLYNREGKGVDKDAEKVLERPGFKNYFKLLGSSISRIFQVNILFIIGNFPLFFILIALAYTTVDVLSPDTQIYPLLQGSAYFDNSPLVATFLGIFGRQDTISQFSTATFVFLGLSLLTLITFGPVNTGTTYILRNLLRGEPIFILSDFWYAIKKNLKQSIIYGLIDALIVAMLTYDVIYYNGAMSSGSSVSFVIMNALSVGLSILYFFIRMYPYLMIVTFDMKMTKILKNSIFFSVLGIKRNLLCLLATGALVALEVFLSVTVMPFAVIIPFLILFGLVQYTSVYCAFPKIKEIMIDPYYAKQKAAESEEAETTE